MEKMYEPKFIKNAVIHRLNKKKREKLRKIRTRIFSNKQINKPQSKFLFNNFRKEKIFAQKRVIPVRLQQKPKCLGIPLKVSYNSKLGTSSVSIFDVNRKVLFEARTSKKVRVKQPVVLSSESSFQSQSCKLLSSVPLANYRQVTDLIKLNKKNVPAFEVRWSILNILGNIIDAKVLTIKTIFQKILFILQNIHDPVRVSKEVISLLGYFKTSTLIRYSIRLFELFSGIPLLSFLEVLIGFALPVVFPAFNISMEPYGDDCKRWVHANKTKIFQYSNRFDWIYPTGVTVQHFLVEERAIIRYSNWRLIEVKPNGSMTCFDLDGSIRTRAAGGMEDIPRGPVNGRRNVDRVLIDKTGLPLDLKNLRAVKEVLQDLQWPESIHVLNPQTGEITEKSILTLRRKR